MQQLQLKRVANIAIDLYGTTAVLARATRALNRDDTSAPHVGRYHNFNICSYPMIHRR